MLKIRKKLWVKYLTRTELEFGTLRAQLAWQEVALNENRIMLRRRRHYWMQTYRLFQG